MAAPNLVIPRRPSLVTFAIFHDKLKNEWKCKACCGREFYRTAEIVRWMLHTDTNEPTSNAGMLLDEVYQDSLHRPRSKDISNEDRRCLVVFAILLELGFGHLVEHFQRYDIIDKKLPMRDIPGIEPLKKHIRGVGPAEFWKQFQERMWLYYSCPLELGMRNTFLDPDRGRWIMPFCKRQPINSKGGTAQVWEVAVQESLVPLKLALAIGLSKFKDDEHGTCYTFALKTFTQKHLEIFEWERDAYLAAQAKHGLTGMVQFLGEYEIDENLDGKIEHTWNIILEYGEYDLEEFFASPKNYPPNLNQETIQFWTSLAKVAEALDAVHDLELERENGRRDSFSGWHCDLKPDNILRIDGEFKLADFGFAKFKRKTPGQVPKEYLTGGTETYGAPECDRARLDPSISVSQTIDTWSFGCVLSVSATWVVVGYQGVLAYHELRRKAIKKLRERQERGDETVTVPAANDAFHNGVDVLPEVKQWHNYLRGCLRVSDTITGRILDLVDEYMLLTESDRQLKSMALHVPMKKKLEDAQHHYNKLLHDGVVGPVTESVKDALLSVEDDESSTVSSHELDIIKDYEEQSSSLSTTSSQPIPRNQFKSSRVKKPQRIAEVVQGKVAHRQEALGRQSNDTITEVAQLGFTNENRRAPRLQLPGTSNSYLLDTRQRSDSAPSTRYSRLSTVPRISAEKEVLTTDPFMSAGSPTAAWDSAHPGTLAESPSHATYASVSGSPLEEYSPSTRDHTPSRTGSRLSASPGSLLVSSPPLQSSLNPSWQIYQEYQALKSKERAFLWRLRPKKQDEYLKKFLVDRDIMFLVDNDMTMSPLLWEWMTVVLETLVSKVDRLDKNGLDIEFTFGDEYNAYGVSSRQLLSKFKDAKDDALSRKYNFKTDMAKTLTHIFDKYLCNARRAKTLLILTDGKWEGTIDSSDVEKAIASFLKKPALAQKLEKRWFTIQFIACGDSVPDILKHLDDEIEKKYSIPDVIDTEHISGDPYKMILGSFVDQYDVVEPSPISPTPASTWLSQSPSTPIIDSPTATPSTSNSVRQNSFRSSKGRSSFRGLFG
ncbi:hypothetical protein GGR54DRAFT_639670 [Hypoxylon sp. NC1633]|nr:hypothetical protein GGR54DRAFT_639670 [Hypoxylon sp. NC1633]